MLALTAIPFYIEGVLFQNVYVILAGDLPLFVAATRIWRIKAAEKRARLSAAAPQQGFPSETPSEPPRTLEIPLPEPETVPPEPEPPEATQAPVDPGAGADIPNPLARDIRPIFEAGTSVQIQSRKPEAQRTSLRLEAEQIKFKPSPKGMSKPAFRCGCKHVHVTTCMTCGMTMKKAMKSRRTRWVDWETAKAAGLVKDVDTTGLT